jgi:hypothetical protein
MNKKRASPKAGIKAMLRSPDPSERAAGRAYIDY